MITAAVLGQSYLCVNIPLRLYLNEVDMTKQKVRTETHHRSSESGRFVTEQFANRHPATTERERIKYPKR